MTLADSSRTNELLEQVGKPHASALGQLLDHHRQRLRRLVAARLDARLAARVDPSDIVQETLADAGRRLPEYLRDRRVPYWIWLRTLALQRLIWWRRFHIVSGKRSVTRERAETLSLSGNTGAPLVESMICSDTSPSAHVVGDEAKMQARLALDSLDPIDRQILDLRYLKERSFAEIASELGLGLSAVKMRHRRALDRFRVVLAETGLDSAS